MRDYGKVVFLIVAALLTPLSLQAQWKTRWEYEGARPQSLEWTGPGVRFVQRRHGTVSN